MILQGAFVSGAAAVAPVAAVSGAAASYAAPEARGFRSLRCRTDAEGPAAGQALGIGVLSAGAGGRPGHWNVRAWRVRGKSFVHTRITPAGSGLAAQLRAGTRCRRGALGRAEGRAVGVATPLKRVFHPVRSLRQRSARASDGWPDGGLGRDAAGDVCEPAPARPCASTAAAT